LSSAFCHFTATKGVVFVTLSSTLTRSMLTNFYRHLKPGGWVEIQELHESVHCDDNSFTDETPYAFRDFLRFLRDGLAGLGSNLHAILTIEEDLQAAGFKDITTRKFRCPVGSWPRNKELRYAGIMLRTAIMDGLRGMTRRPYGSGLGWTELQIQMFLVEVRKALMNDDFHTYLPLHITYGQKPLE
jgi:hypothetical protein